MSHYLTKDFIMALDGRLRELEFIIAEQGPDTNAGHNRRDIQAQIKKENAAFEAGKNAGRQLAVVKIVDWLEAIGHEVLSKEVDSVFLER